MDTGVQGDQEQEQEERMCDTSSTEAPLPAGSILATLQAAQRGSSMSALEAEQVFLSLMEDGSLDLDTLMERISGAEPEDGRRLPAEVEAGVRRLQRFSMATTSNGVSVVISLRRDEEGQGGDGGGSGGWVVVSGARFRYKLSLIDIELKPLASKPEQGNKLQFIKRGCKKYSKLCRQLSRQLSRQISTQMANHISLEDVPRFQIGFFLAFLAAVVLLGALVYESSKFF